MMNNEMQNTSQFLFYAADDGAVKVQVIIEGETVWATQKGMAEIFDVEVPAISKHISNIYSENELQREATVSKMEIVRKEGSRQVKRAVDYYNLDMLIAVGYRVNSQKATQFRIWATQVLKEYLIKGFALNDDRLKQGNELFGKDYFDELIERIREIRASERRFYQKITDLYAQASIDYDKTSPITTKFYSIVQNKFHYAIHGRTASELISDRAGSDKPNMGLTSWKNEKIKGKIVKSDVSVAKNYLTEDELGEMNRLVSQYLDFAENMAKRRKAMTMQDWIGKLDEFLALNEYELLVSAGSVSSAVAKKLAEAEYEKYRPLQDRVYASDFDRVVDKIKIDHKVPNTGD